MRGFPDVGLMRALEVLMAGHNKRVSGLSPLHHPACPFLSPELQIDHTPTLSTLLLLP